MHVYGPFICVRVHAPDFVHKLEPRKDHARVAHQLIEQIKLLFGQRELFVPPGHGEGVIIQRGAANSQEMLGDGVGPAQERPHPQHHLSQVDGLDHIVIRPGGETALLVRKGLLGGDDEDGLEKARLAQGMGEGVAVHLGHHQIGDDQIHMLVVHEGEGALPILGGQGGVAVLPEHGADERAQMVVVLDHKDTKHGLIPPEIHLGFTLFYYYKRKCGVCRPGGEPVNGERMKKSE